MEQSFKKLVPLDIGTLNMQISFKFEPNGIVKDNMHLTNPVTLKSSFTKTDPATDNQRRAISGMARRLGREVNLDQLSKREASNLIDQMCAELRRK